MGAVLKPGEQKQGKNITPGSVTLHGSVPVNIDGKEIISLAGSATIVKIGWKTYLVDLWMFQWWEAADFFNKENIDFLKNIDGVFITHSHIDHIWRLPLLYKLGYRWPIYMTHATSKITHKMLLDSCKIQEGEMLEKQARNKNLGSRLKKALKIQTYLSDKRDKDLNITASERRRYLINVLGEGYDTNKIQAEMKQYLEFYWVSDEYDIEKVLESLKLKQYDESDVESTMWLIKTIEKWEELVLASKTKRSKNNNHPQQELLDNLPLQVNQWFEQSIEIGSQSEARKLWMSWKQKFSQEVRKQLLKHKGYPQEIDNFKKSLEIEYTIKQQYESVPKNTPRLDKVRYKKANKYLDKYSISHIKDIEDIITQLKQDLDAYKNTDINLPLTWISDLNIEIIEWLVDSSDTKLSFHINDIQKARRLLKTVPETAKERDSISVKVYDAAHIIGSASIVLTAASTKNKVNETLDISGDSVSIALSWDMWRIDHNRLWKPEVPPTWIDYLQMESTYGWKEHRPREESVKDLVDSIEQSEWNVLISVFSQQRAQEILQTLLEEKLKSKGDLLNNPILIDAPLARDVTNIYMQYEWEYYNLLDPITQIELFWWEVFRFLKEWEWEEVYGVIWDDASNKHILESLMDDYKNDTNRDWIELITTLQKHIFDEQLFSQTNSGNWEFIGDTQNKGYQKVTGELSGLSDNTKIVSSYQIFWWLQEELFGRKFFSMDESGQYKKMELAKKYIILASSGMMDGGAIMNHLPHILKDEKATLLAPWYLSEGTLWNDIVIKKMPQVTISGVKEQVLCQHKFVDGFSSHIWHTDILIYLTDIIEQWLFKPNATIALNHGNMRWQKILKSDIEEILKEHARTDINVTIPEIFEEYNVNTRQFQADDSGMITEYIPKNKCVTPTYLFKTQDEPSQKEPELEKTQKYQDNTNRNTKLFSKAHSLLSQWYKDITTHCMDLFHTKNVEWYYKNFDRYHSQLEGLWNFQKSDLLRIVKQRLKDNNQLSADISGLNWKIKNITQWQDNISNFISEIEDFFISIVPDIDQEINILQQKIVSIREEMKNLSDKYENDKQNTSVDISRNSSTTVSFESEKRTLKNRLKSYQNQIDRKEKEKKETQKQFQKSIQDISEREVKIKLAEIIKGVSQGEQYNTDMLQDVFEPTRQRLLSKQSELNNKRHLQPDIVFQERSPRFAGENMYWKVMDTSSEFDIDVFQEYVNDTTVNTEEQSVLSDYIWKIKSSWWKIQKKHIAELKKYLKKWEKENQDQWINTTLDIENLQSTCISLLKWLFTEEYFNTYINTHFNIYLFLNTRTHLHRYIEIKYDLTKLKGYKKHSSKFEASQDYLDNISTLMGDMNVSKDIGSELEYTISEITKLIQQTWTLSK